MGKGRVERNIHKGGEGFEIEESAVLTDTDMAACKESLVEGKKERSTLRRTKGRGG